MPLGRPHHEPSADSDDSTAARPVRPEGCLETGSTARAIPAQVDSDQTSREVCVPEFRSRHAETLRTDEVGDASEFAQATHSMDAFQIFPDRLSRTSPVLRSVATLCDDALDSHRRFAEESLVISDRPKPLMIEGESRDITWRMPDGSDQ